MEVLEDKLFSIKFKLTFDILAILYICYKNKFPAVYFITFYEKYGPQSLYVFKALACGKKMALNDNAFTKVIEESRLLQQEILRGISINIKREKLACILKNGGTLKEPIPDYPQINLTLFSEDYANFIENYLICNTSDIFSDEIQLWLDTKDLYEQLV